MALLIVIGPLGWIVLACIAISSWLSDMKPTGRRIVAGFLFPPLWTPLVWALRLPRRIRPVMLAAIVGAYLYGLYVLTNWWTVPLIALVATAIFGIVWGSRLRETPYEAEKRRWAEIHQELEGRLDACNGIIAQIEEGLSTSAMPMSPSLRHRYTDALEMRSEAVEMLREAETHSDLASVRTRMNIATEALRQVQGDLKARMERHAFDVSLGA